MKDENIITVDSGTTTLNVKPESVVSQNIWPKDKRNGNCWWKASLCLERFPPRGKTPQKSEKKPISS